MVTEEKMFENVDRRMDGRQSDWYTISSPMSLRLRWANNKDTDLTAWKHGLVHAFADHM